VYRRRSLSLLTSALVLVPTVALAGATAEGTALSVGGVATVSQSDSDGGATALEVLGTEVVGTKDGETNLASSKDAGVPTDVAEVTVLRAEASEGSASSDALVVNVGGEDGLTATAMSSSSSSDGESAQAHSHGLEVGGGGLGSITVLDADVTEKGGSTAVVDIAGTRLLSEEQVGSGMCELDLSPLVDLSALCVSAIADGYDAGIAPTVNVLDDTVRLRAVSGSATGGPTVPTCPEGEPSTAATCVTTPEGPTPTPTPTDPDPDPDPTPTPTETPTVIIDYCYPPRCGTRVLTVANERLPVTGAGGLAGILTAALGLIGGGAFALRRREEI
jgi:hypothetical protein